MDLVPTLQAGAQYGDFCFSQDSKYLFCCCGAVVKVYNTNNGECLHDLKGHAIKVTGLIVNPSNFLQLITCGQDGRLIYWDYLDGVKLKEFNLHVPLHGIVSINADKKSLMMIAATSEHKKTFSLMKWKRLKPTYSEFGKPKILIELCSEDRRLMSFGCSKEIVASALDHKVTVYSMEKESSIIIKDKDKFNQNKAVTCVVCHPKEYIVACGYENGKIILWHNILQHKPVPSLRHWHVLPVLCLDFSVDGSILLSGGHECVLVRWQMSNAHQKDFKPRMGAPITHVMSSPDGSFYATKHSDNVLQLLNINLKILQVYRGLTRNNMGLRSDKNLIPSGLKYDPRSRALVTNGLPGHLQFYSLGLQKQLFNLDIVGQNYISPENLDRPKVITEVTCTAISDDGCWLATFECWDDGYFTPELRMKLWSWSPEAQTYSLNTTVECPHDGNVTSMVFRPTHNQLQRNAPMLVTVGKDKCFKVWTLIDDTDIYRNNTRWNGESVGFYRYLEATCADFSNDASVLAVGFEHLVTVWDPDRNVVKTTLTNSLPQKENVLSLKFGSHSCKHYLVVATEKTVLAWDLFTLNIVWTMPQDQVRLFQDPSSELMAFVTNSQRLYVFRPSSPNPVYEQKKVSSCPVLDSLFVPDGRPNDVTGIGWPGSSQIYLFNEEEELITFDRPEREASCANKTRIAQNLPDMSLSTLIAEKLVRETEDEKDVFRPISTATQSEQDSFTSMILHSNEPVSLHCSQFLHNCLVKRKTKAKGKSDMELDDEESSESEMETEEVPAVKVETQNDTDSQREEQFQDKLLTRPPPKDWIQWCAALKLK